MHDRPGSSRQVPTLSAELLLRAYRRGMFPMAEPGLGREPDEIYFYSPDPRAILPLDDFHVPKNVARLVRQGRFDIRSDTAFEQVMRACAEPRPSEPMTWINEEMIHAYCALFERGHAHTIEAWLDGRLIGGLYGVHIGGAFCGESMFIRPELGGSNASKVCLVHLVRHLNAQGFQLLDTQFWNAHLDQFGCVEIPRAEYLRRLAAAVNVDAWWGEVAA